MNSQDEGTGVPGMKAALADFKQLSEQQAAMAKGRRLRHSCTDELLPCRKLWAGESTETRCLPCISGLVPGTAKSEPQAQSSKHALSPNLPPSQKYKV